MSHRHILGEKLSEFFVAQRNSDQTEGRGGMVDMAVFEDRFLALEKVRGQGVQGCGDGDIVLRRYFRCEGCPEIVKTDERIYHGDNYTKRQAGKRGFERIMPDGWNADWSPMTQDPEYKEYLRLREKFEK